MIDGLRFSNVEVRTPAGEDLLTIPDLSLPNGLIAVTGRNGAGKSTLLRTIVDLHPLAGGAITLGGVDSRSDRRKFLEKTAFQPQNFSTYPELSALAFLTYFGRLRGLGARSARANAGEWLRRVDLARDARRATGTFSQGMLQRLGLAYVLQTDASGLYLLDEPFAGVDPDARKSLIALLASHAKDRVVLLCTHHVDEAFAQGAREARVADGTLTLA